ncbi:MAG: type ISP restriction/modification enzyme [Pirellulaceae bacterium]
MTSPLRSAVSAFGASAKAKLANPAARGEPEEQLRAPLEGLLLDLAELCRIPRQSVVAVGESALADLKTRPDFAVSARGVLVGFIEVKAPGKGADPRRFKDRHDREQWEKLQSLPNLIYTDGNAFSLWRSGELASPIVRLVGDIESSGAELDAPPSLLKLLDDFFQWEPIPPRDARQLATTAARLCRLLRDEVTEQLAAGSPALTALAADWRKLLFPDASDERFADGYAQAVTFGLLMARAQDIRLQPGLDQVAKQLGRTNSLIGAALRLLTDDAENQATLKTSLGTLTRVLDAVQWSTISKDDPDAWLYFYENFLEVYDNALRKLTGSYYTPPEVVGSMVRLADEALKSRFHLPAGLAAPAVTLADPAVGTGTFLLGTLRHIAQSVAADEGPGAVPEAIRAAIGRLVAFELQLGPFAVAQLRILAELVDLIGEPPKTPLRMYVTDTLGNPYAEQEWFPQILGPIADSRRLANEIKRREKITVVIGNPPYKEKAKGRGSWVEAGDGKQPSLLGAWLPPRQWGVGTHAKHLRNLYVYFWRWATWKVFDQNPDQSQGIVCFITVAGFLNGPGFQKMRDDLRRKCDEIWVIDCSPEGHQPEVNTRIFQGVQQPVCIVLASRSAKRKPEDVPAKVRYRALPAGHRTEKFAALAKVALKSRGWIDCPTDWRAAFLPEATGDWAGYPALTDLFRYHGSGVMPGRTWIIAPDAESLERRWQTLIKAPADKKEKLFHPHLQGDRHINRVVIKGLPGYEARLKTIAQDREPCNSPIRYGFRSFDRQWIIPDNRVINRANPELWEVASDAQVYLTAPSDRSPSSGPALTFTALIPDLHHYAGRGGRAIPLWGNAAATVSNVAPGLLQLLAKKYRRPVRSEDLLAYIAAVAANPAYTKRFKSDLVQPGLRIPITASAKRFFAAVELGETIIWLHTFGERFIDPRKRRPSSPPRLPVKEGPRIPAAGAIAGDAMPDSIEYDATRQRLLVGKGYIERVTPAMWAFEVSGKQVLTQWFSYRKANRERPIIGDRRPPSKLGDIQPDRWLSEYTSELLSVLHVLGWLVRLEPDQAKLLDQICSGPTIPAAELQAALAAQLPAEPAPRGTSPGGPTQLTFLD